LAGFLRRYWSALAGAPFWLYAGGVAPCPEPRGLKARRPVFRQVLTPRLPSLSLGAAVRSQTERLLTMENVRELPADSLEAILSGPALQELARRTAIHTLSRLRKEASAEIERLLAFLDASDPYVTTELEEQVDDGPIDEDELEPSFCGVTAGERKLNLASLGDELEADYGHGQDANDEPSLGSVAVGEHVTQVRWAQGGANDTEDEHDGAEPDEADYEPSIGFDPCTIVAEEDTGEMEPSLGWTVDGYMGGTNEPDLE
jgi:hypothetical protein